ncbi:MAG TPA: SOS response-associated peptidase family protein [Tabrizicola sp.]|nr:SOS response-associated peptidase family protein [Tabrizicola sp.]
MCNIFKHTTSAEAMRWLFDGLVNEAGSIETGEICPEQTAPILTARDDGHVFRKARWRLLSPPQFHSHLGIARGVTNVRNVGSPNWRRRLGQNNRCLVPVDRFAEPRPGGRGAGSAWFKFVSGRPMFFAGVWVPGWTSIRKLQDGATIDDLFAFPSCEPNVEVAAIHSKAMPVVLVEPQEWIDWLSQDWAQAKTLQRLLEDASLELTAV